MPIDEDIPITYATGPSDPMCLTDQPGTFVEADIAAPPARVWDLVTDLELPARFSEELLGADWVDGRRGPGAAFVGRNHHPAIGEWEIECYVEHDDEGRCFGWATADRDNPGARWRFDLEPTDDGTRLRYSMSMGPGPSGISMAIESMPEKEPRILRRRVAEHHVNMQRTLDGIKALAEADA